MAGLCQCWELCPHCTLLNFRLLSVNRTRLSPVKSCFCCTPEPQGSWQQGEMILYVPELSCRCSRAMQCWPRGVGAMGRGAVYSPISSYLITVPKLAFSSGKGKQKRGAGVGRKGGEGISRGDAGPFLYIPTKVKRSMGGRTQQIRLRLSPTFPKIFAKGEEGKLMRERERGCAINPSE